MRKILTCFIVFFLAIGLFPCRCFGEGQVLTIMDAESFLAFADEVNRGNLFYKDTIVLKNDIEVLEMTCPIGDYRNPFCGIFDGEGHSIEFCLQKPHNIDIGLFGCTYGATIKGLTLRGEVCADEKVGAFAGSATNTEFIYCCNEMDVSGNGEVGGFVGDAFGNVLFNKCVNKGRIYCSKENVGIFVGRVDNPSMVELINCNNLGYIELDYVCYLDDFSDSGGSSSSGTVRSRNSI